MPAIHLSDLQTNYQINGFGTKTIVLINGLGLDQHTWGAFADHLSLTHQVLRFDARGAGVAKDTGEPLSTKSMAGDVLALCAALNISRPIVLGFSMGGFVAQHVAAIAPEAISGLILLSTVARMSPRSVELLALWRDLTAAGLDRTLLLRSQLLWASEERFYADEGALQATIDYVLSIPETQAPSGLIRQANACINHDSSGICQSFLAPTLVLVGAQERVFSVPEVHALSQQIPHSRYQCFPQGGHNLWLEYPVEVAEAISKFTASLG
jgi:3-oxoadipate enol-lactonase